MSLIIIGFLLLVSVSLSSAKGISKKRPVFAQFGTRFHDVSEDFPCEQPPFTKQLPVRLRAKVELIWKDVDRNANCWVEMARTRNVLLRLTTEERALIAKPAKDCVPPSVQMLPQKARQRVTEIWRKRDASKGCWDRQKRTRLLLLNLPIVLKKLAHPPTFDCDVPHFIDRLEPDLQKKLRKVWQNYERGQPCVERIDEQLQILEKNDISLQSFQMPPPTMFRRYELLRKLRRESVA